MTLTINHNISRGSYTIFDHEIKLDMYLFLLLTGKLQQFRKFSFSYLFFVFESYKNLKKKKSNFQSLLSLNLMIYFFSEYINY